MSELATTEDFSVVRQEGKRQVRRQIKHYNLDAIISVGYRVASGLSKYSPRASGPLSPAYFPVDTRPVDTRPIEHWPDYWSFRMLPSAFRQASTSSTVL
ncbi:virulence RhuM family protein [Halomonas cupida]|uniref:RhuM family protein n=1 Tax=Halomonas cupida TaxID=44933 RepID=UPI001F3FD406|nr:RhuM family protein [Halomonas cupida]